MALGYKRETFSFVLEFLYKNFAFLNPSSPNLYYYIIHYVIYYYII
jgi:hypothetical protein